MKDFKAAIAKPRKIALYASLLIDDMVTPMEVHYVDYDEHFMPLPAGEQRERSKDGYVRISNVVDASFAPLSDDFLIQNAVKSLDAEEIRLRMELSRKLADLQERRAQLLCLTHQEAV
jgi:hypothetical protein